MAKLMPVRWSGEPGYPSRRAARSGRHTGLARVAAAVATSAALALGGCGGSREHRADEVAVPGTPPPVTNADKPKPAEWFSWIDFTAPKPEPLPPPDAFRLAGAPVSPWVE